MVWPPQDTGIFEFKMPCCECAQGLGLWGTGFNGDGELGLGDLFDRNVFTQVGSDTWLSVGYNVSSLHNLGVKSDGTLWAWGSNNWGELGQGDFTARDVPTQVGTDANWVSCAAGGQNTGQSFALKTDGTLWACGYNGDGELGLGDFTDRDTFTQVGADTDWALVISGLVHALALKTDGTLWSWGFNGSGQLGLGDFIPRNVPTQIGAISTWASIGVGSENGFAIKADGTFWVWGANGNGELGRGAGPDLNVPTQVGSGTNWRQAAGAAGHSVALKTDGTIWSTGTNTVGELGQGDFTSRNTWTQIGSSTDWDFVACGGNSSSQTGQSYAIKVDGTLWSFGFNATGQLGLGDNLDRNAPNQVGTDAWATIVGGWQQSMAMR